MEHEHGEVTHSSQTPTTNFATRSSFVCAPRCDNRHGTARSACEQRSKGAGGPAALCAWAAAAFAAADMAAQCTNSP